jgi:hypothetical protein
VDSSSSSVRSAIEAADHPFLAELVDNGQLVDTEVPHGGRHQVLKQPVDTLRSHLIAEPGELDIEGLDLRLVRGAELVKAPPLSQGVEP